MPTHGLRTFEDSVSIVTGGASGIGRALAEQLVARGGTVVLADRDEEVATVATRIDHSGTRATAAVVDVTDAEAVERLVAAAFTDHGRVDYMFNNAGIGFGGEVQDLKLEHWERVLDVNVRGVVYGVHACYRRMIAQGFGHIVNTASVAGFIPTPGTINYGASKHAVVGLSKGLRVEAAQYGIRVSALCPGAIRTPILSGGKYGGMAGEMSRTQMAELWELLRPMEPRRFARKALDAVAKNRSTIIVPWWWKAAWVLERAAPSLSLAVLERIYGLTMKTVRSKRGAS